LKAGFEVRGGWINKGDDGKEEDGEVIMVKDDAFFEAVTFFIFAFEEEGFEFGVVMVMEFEKCLGRKEKKLENEVKNG